MTIDDQVRDEKLLYDINKEAAKISALSSGEIDKYEYLTGEEILPSNQQQIIEQANFTYSLLDKAFEKQTKTIKDQGEKQVDALESLESFDKQLPSIKEFLSKERLNADIIDETERIEKEKRKADRSKMVYKGSNEAYDFRKFKKMRVFGNKIRNSSINISMANDEQHDLSKHIREFKSKTRPQSSKSKRLRQDVINSAMALLKEREMVFKAFESGIFLKPEELKQSEQSSDSNIPIFTPKEETGLKILTPKQMTQRLPTALAQVNAGNNSESLLNEIRKIVYSLYKSKDIVKKVYNNS